MLLLVLMLVEATFYIGLVRDWSHAVFAKCIGLVSLILKVIMTHSACAFSHSRENSRSVHCTEKGNFAMRKVEKLKWVALQ